MITLSKEICFHCFEELRKSSVVKEDVEWFEKEWERGYTPCDVTGILIRTSTVRGMLPVRCPHLFEHSVAVVRSSGT